MNENEMIIEAVSTKVLLLRTTYINCHDKNHPAYSPEFDGEDLDELVAYINLYNKLIGSADTATRASEITKMQAMVDGDSEIFVENWLIDG